MTSIERRVEPYVVLGDDTVLTALGKITDNKAGIVFCVDSRGVLLGSVSDGDFRRWVTAAGDIDLARPVIELANRECRTLADGTDPVIVDAAFGPGVQVIPFVDDAGHVTAVARRGGGELRIGGHRIGPGAPAFLIAEIGNNHQGDVQLAKRLIELAHEAGADAVKFQLRDMAGLFRSGSVDAAGGEDLGPQYTMNLLAKYSLGVDQIAECLEHARQVGIEAFVTPWDEPSLAALTRIGVPALKIASADLTNHALLRAAAATGLPMLVSTGMSSEDEIVSAVEVLRRHGAPFALLHCQSAYPAPFKDVNLRYMDRLAELGQCPVGYSGHERGIHVPVAAVARGAALIEKHFTVDKTLEGNDHQVSLLPEEFARMVSRVREVESALGTQEARAVSTGELMNRANLAKSLVATRRLEVGTQVSREDVAIRAPGRGLQPNHLEALIGRRLDRVLEVGDFFYATDVSGTVSAGRRYSFRRPWGLPVRYHDARALVENNETNPDFVEFHLSFHDAALDLSQVRSLLGGGFPGLGFAVHCPDLYAGDFIIDLASPDEAVWERSIAEVQHVIGTARALRPLFDQPQDPVVICTMGGFTRDGFIDAAQRQQRYDRVARALERIDASEVRLTAQTLPPFPWLMGGQQHHNLFVGLEDTVDFCRQHGLRLTLDLSHTKLAANHAHRAF